MKISALASSLPAELPRAIEQLAELGFNWIDVPPAAAEGDARQKIHEHQLDITCVGLERGQPAGLDLASSDVSIRTCSIAYFCRAIELARDLGAPAGYVTPPAATDDESRCRWTNSLLRIAEHACRCAVRVCIEHFPRRLLPSAADTLRFLDEAGHDNLALLIDVGHCLISGESPAAVVAAAGTRLGYIHFDDNDGQSDLHWPLLTGRLTEQQIRDTIDALRTIGYDGGVCLELQAKLDDPAGNLRRGKIILERFIEPCKSSTSKLSS